MKILTNMYDNHWIIVKPITLILLHPGKKWQHLVWDKNKRSRSLGSGQDFLNFYGFIVCKSCKRYWLLVSTWWCFRYKIKEGKCGQKDYQTV